MFNAFPDVSPMLFRRISSLRITPITSSNFKVFEPETELLTAMTKPFQLSGSNTLKFDDFVGVILSEEMRRRIAKILGRADTNLDLER